MNLFSCSEQHIWQQIRTTAFTVRARSWRPFWRFCGASERAASACVLCSLLTIKKLPGEAAGSLSRGLLPLITVGVIVAGVFKLAVVGVMGGPAIGALYSAIAGYVLGRTSRPYKGSENRVPPASTAPPAHPPPAPTQT
jgi:hypothetical protein